MSRQIQHLVALLLIGLTIFSGCTPTQPFYFHEDGDLSHYLDKATQIEQPDYDDCSLAEVTHSKRPLTLTNPEFEEFWDIPLEECIHIAIHNSKVIRDTASILQTNPNGNVGLSGNNNLGHFRVANLPTVYDPSLEESRSSGQISTQGPITGQNNGQREIAGGTQGVVSPGGIGSGVQGIEHELAEFDALFAARFSYDKQDSPSNVNAGVAAQFTPFLFEQNNASLGMSLSKKAADGTIFALRHNTRYSYSNAPSRALPSDYLSGFEVNAVHPLLKGRGVQVNRTRIILARMNTDIQLASFEASVRNLLQDVENAYWDLQNAYRSLESAKIGRDSAHITWKIVYEKWKQGVEPVQAEAQAREQYFFFRAQTESQLRVVYDFENDLRWLMGLSATDGRLLRPSDEPTLAKVEFDWNEVLAEALFKNTELRQQRWRLKQREHEIILARNNMLPELNVTATYRWHGRGDTLMNANRNGLDFAQPGSTAFDNISGGDFAESYFNLDFVPNPIGARRASAAMRNAQLQLAREKARTEEMELALSHSLTKVVRALDGLYLQSQSHFNRWLASQREVDSLKALYEGGKASLDLVLDAQRRRAEAQRAYYSAIAEYNKQIAFMHFNKGSLFEYNSIALSEGPWPDKAYWDALERARERVASYYMDYGVTRPRVVSRGPVASTMGGSEGEYIIDDTTAPVEELQVPTPAGDELMPPEIPMDDSPAPVTSTQPRSANSDQNAASQFSWGPLALTQATAVDVPESKADHFDWGTVGSSLRANEAGLPAVRQATHTE